MPVAGSIAGPPRRPRGRLVLLPLFSVLILLAAEAGLRLVFPRNADGNVIIYGRTLAPAHPPLTGLREEVDIYELSTRTRLVADPELGWTLRPNTVSSSGLYASDAMGARVAAADGQAPVPPSSNRTRVVLLGDSFTYGEEAPFESTWGHLLDEYLKRQTPQAEVINLGVPAYGLDQAYLRWKTTAAWLKPDIVLLGLPMENIHRMVNILRPLYVPAGGLPFSKPRARLRGDALEWANAPAMPPRQTLATLGSLDTWELSPLEHFMPPADRPAWSYSRFLALLHEVCFPVENDPFFYDPNGEPGALALAILQAWDKEVATQGGRLVILHFPLSTDLIRLKVGLPLPYEPILSVIEARHRVIRCQDALSQTAKETGLRSLFMPAGHYSAVGSAAIAKEAASALDATPGQSRVTPGSGVAGEPWAGHAEAKSSGTVRLPQLP